MCVSESGVGFMSGELEWLKGGMGLCLVIQREAWIRPFITQGADSLQEDAVAESEILAWTLYHLVPDGGVEAMRGARHYSGAVFVFWPSKTLVMISAAFTIHSLSDSPYQTVIQLTGGEDALNVT